MRDLEAAAAGDVITRVVSSPAETEAVGEAVGRNLDPGEVLLLVGDLGAGKTTFVRGLARGLGVAFGVKSPSFAIHLRYPGRLPLDHLDLYRLANPRDLAELGLEDVLGRDGVTVVEWGERLGDRAPATAVVVRFEDLGDDRRRLIVEGPSALLLRIRAAGGWEEPAIGGGEESLSP